MRQLSIKNSILNVFTLSLLICTFLVSSANAQEDEITSITEMEQIQDENMDYMKQIHKIIRDYPAFSYSYDIDDGKVEDVTVTGVDNNIDKKRLEVILFDLKSNKNRIKNKANRIGVFYSVDEKAEYEAGRDELQQTIQSNLRYPGDAKNWGVEGTVFVKFVVDENGEIPFATTSSNIETSMEKYLKDLEQQAVTAIKATSGNWEPGKVEGVEVASMIVIPVNFDFRKNPSLPTLIP